MDPVVAEHPCLDDVQRRQHEHASERAVESLRVEQRAVRGVVTEHEQTGDREAGEDPQRQEQPPGVRQREQRQRGDVDDDRAGDVGESLRGAALIAVRRDDAQHRQQRVGALRAGSGGGAGSSGGGHGHGPAEGGALVLGQLGERLRELVDRRPVRVGERDELGQVELVDLGRVLREHLAQLLRLPARERPAQRLLRVRRGRFHVRVVAAPHDAVDADLAHRLRRRPARGTRRRRTRCGGSSRSACAGARPKGRCRARRCDRCAASRR